MRMILFLKMFKIWCSSRSGTKNWENVFRFWDNCIWIGSCKLSQSWTGYLALSVNVVTNTPKISLNTRADIFQIKPPEDDEETWKKYSLGDFASIWDAFTCFLSKRVLKQHFLESGLTKFFTVCNFGNTLAKVMVLLFKRVKIWCRFRKWNKKLRQSFSFFRSLHLNREWQILTIWNRILVILSQCVNKHP